MQEIKIFYPIFFLFYLTVVTAYIIYTIKEMIKINRRLKEKEKRFNRWMYNKMLILERELKKKN